MTCPEKSSTFYDILKLLTVFQELLDPKKEMISRVAAILPAGFPASVAESIFADMRRAKAKAELLP